MSQGDSTSAEHASAPSERPSGVRHIIVTVATLMAVLLYLDRFCVGFAVDYIREDLDLSQKQISWFISAFFWSYALAQVPAGWMSDRYGARIMLTIYILSWSFFTGMIGAVYSLTMLLAMRLGIGLGQAGAYPTSASVVSKWVPFSNRGMASAIISFGGRSGGALAPLLTALLIVSFVPVSHSSLLTEEGLRDIPGMVQRFELVEPVPAADSSEPVEPEERSESVEHVWTSLDESTRDLFVEIAARVPAAGSDEAAGQSEVPISAEEREKLTAAMNELIADPEFFTRGTVPASLDRAASSVFDALKLDRTALGYMKQVNEGEQLTEADQQRFHRLLLEATFPGEVSKIYVSGWRPVMFIYGACGIIVAGCVWFFFRTRPEEHPWCNAAEARLIESGRPVGAPSPHGKAGMVPLKRLLLSRSMWFICFMQVGTNVGWLFIYVWLPRYLLEVHNVPILQRGLMSTIPPAIGIVGLLGGGWLTDTMASMFGLRWGRRFPMMFTRFLAATGYGIVLLLATATTDFSPWLFIAAFSLVAFATDMGIAATWAFKQDVGGRYVGSILGWGNMWGNLGAACSPLIYNYFLGETPSLSDWNNMFFVCMGAFIFSGLCALGVDASIPIAPPDEDEEEAEVAEST